MARRLRQKEEVLMKEGTIQRAEYNLQQLHVSVLKHLHVWKGACDGVRLNVR